MRRLRQVTRQMLIYFQCSKCYNWAVYRWNKIQRVLEHKHEHSIWDRLFKCKCSDVNMTPNPFNVQTLDFISLSLSLIFKGIYRKIIRWWNLWVPPSNNNFINKSCNLVNNICRMNLSWRNKSSEMHCQKFCSKSL